ncbi:MAG: division/cell wall cluster transcriptional repressor MraZ [Thermodesulfovibrionales bacterium]|nr:division/cell wall cluster transcriptional repressor MraZ [Thermodesulfovibrionales bacterium]
MPSFIGKYYHTLDSKGRIMLPIPLREVLYKKYNTDKLYITNSAFDRCLHLYPSEEWMRLEEKIRNLPKMDEAVKFFLRRVVASAAEVTLDKQGRVLIPYEQRRDANINNEVVIVGQIDKIEIWEKTEWDAVADPSKIDKKDFEAKLISYGI